MSDDLVERLRARAKRMNGALVGASDGHTYAVGYYDQFCAKDDVKATERIKAVASELEAAQAEIERLKNQLGDPEGVIAHADAITAIAEKAEEDNKRLRERGKRLANAAENFATRFNINSLAEDDDRQRQAVLDQVRLFRAALERNDG